MALVFHLLSNLLIWRFVELVCGKWMRLKWENNSYVSTKDCSNFSVSVIRVLLHYQYWVADFQTIDSIVINKTRTCRVFSLDTTLPLSNESSKFELTYILIIIQQLNLWTATTNRKIQQWPSTTEWSYLVIQWYISLLS